MTINISNLTVNINAPSGTIVGLLTAHDASGTAIPCNFTLTKNSAGFFAISGNSLITAFSGSIFAGIYSVRVHASGTNTRFSGNAVFNITVNMAPSPPPPPPSPVPIAIALTPANSTMADNAGVGTLIATATVTMSDGSTFTGTLTTSETNFFAIEGLNIVTARALTSADDGTHTTVITASQGSHSLSQRFSI